MWDLIKLVVSQSGKAVKYGWRLLTFWTWFKRNEVKLRSLYKCLDAVLKFIATNPDLTKISRDDLVEILVRIQTQMKVVDDIGDDLKGLYIEGFLDPHK